MAVALTAVEAFGVEPATTTPRGEIDADTIEGCRSGDPAALRCFVLFYQRNVFAFLSRMTGAGPHVEDLAQEVFLRAYRAFPRFESRPDARLSTWLLSIAVRLVLDSRKRRRIATVPLSDKHERGHSATPEWAQRRREIAEAFERAAAELPEEQRLVFVLAQFHGLGYAAIAELVGAPENTVKTRLFRARTRLRELLAATWDEHS